MFSGFFSVSQIQNGNSGCSFFSCKLWRMVLFYTLNLTYREVAMVVLLVMGVLTDEFISYSGVSLESEQQQCSAVYKA